MQTVGGHAASPVEKGQWFGAMIVECYLRVRRTFFFHGLSALNESSQSDVTILGG